MLHQCFKKQYNSSQNAKDLFKVIGLTTSFNLLVVCSLGLHVDVGKCRRMITVGEDDEEKKEE